MRILLLFLLAACGVPEYSPWQADIEYRDLTAKNLEKLEQTNREFESFTVALTGDPQVVVGHLKRVISVTNLRSDLSFITILGDITDMGLRREWIWVGDIIKGSNKPVLTVVGNHDGLTKGKKIYPKMFGPYNYSYTYRDIKFVMWNNNGYEWGVDFDWLSKQVASHNKVVVMSHQPPFSGTLKPKQEERWKKIRANPNYIASIHGHVHNYNYRFENETNTAIYTVDRVTGTHYGAISFTSEGISLENCTPSCTTIARESWDRF